MTHLCAPCQSGSSIKKRLLWASIASAISMAALTVVPAANAEAPLETDGAETESEGAFEAAAQIFTEEDSRGLEVEVGYVPFENIEIEIEVETAQNSADDPASRESEAGFSLKWVPEQSGQGLAYGVRFSIGRELEDDRQGEKEYETERSVVGVFSYDFQSGPKVHFNIGMAHEAAEEEDEESEFVTIYALGMEKRISRRFTVTGEVYGEANARATQALGLRYKASGDTSIFARLGRTGDESFAAIGVAFEFEPD
ncbi:MAG: hypothetical protein ACRBC3_09150 [Burkholderiaceae bacterium]